MGAELIHQRTVGPAYAIGHARVYYLPPGSEVNRWYTSAQRPFESRLEEAVTVPLGARERPDQWVAAMHPVTADHFRIADGERLEGMEVLLSEGVPHRQVLFLPKALVNELRRSGGPPIHGA